MQGSERDIIILSCVRTLTDSSHPVSSPDAASTTAIAFDSSGPSLTVASRDPAAAIGFLDDPRRMNVALTRGKFACWIVGNSKALETSVHWRALVQHCVAMNCTVIVSEASTFDLKSIASVAQPTNIAAS